MSSFLDFEGVYDKTKRYFVKNWSDEDFTQSFGSETAYNDNNVIEVRPAYALTIKSGEMRELSQFEAYIFTKHFVDREMFKAAAKAGDRIERERAEMGVNNREARKPFEDKTISEVKLGEATPFMDALREQIRKEEQAKLNAVPTSEDKVEAPIEEPKVKAEEDKSEEFEGVK